MCDYSLHAVATRPAKVGDKLVSSRFSQSITRGFVAVGEPGVAVCLLPGTEVAFEQDPCYERGWGIFTKRRLLPEKAARFRQVNIDNPNAHHDALEFSDGTTVLVTQLRPGQRLSVLQLPAGSRHQIDIEQPAREPALE